MAADNLLASPAPLLTEQILTTEVKLSASEADTTILLEDTTPSHVCEWMTTNLRLPRISNYSKEEDTHLCLPVHVSEASYFKQNEEKEEYKDDAYESTATDLRLIHLHNYLANMPLLMLSNQRFQYSNPETQGSINQHNQTRRSKYDRQSKVQMPPKQCPPPHRLITSTNSGRVIDVQQGEIAHCTPLQADTICSDDATTCHIVALWSNYSGSTSEISDKVLATITHIDGTGYEQCIREAVNEHVRYHSNHAKQNISTSNENDEAINMSIHIMGGFNDIEGSSIEITDSILQTLAVVSNECNSYSYIDGVPHLCMTLETCAVGSANDDGTGSPLGRGLAMNVVSGNVFLAEVEDDTQGPEAILRSVRLWASAFHKRSRRQSGKLNVIHNHTHDYISIEPFFFCPPPTAKSLLDCSNEELLNITSTSPSVEKFNFAANVRQSLMYMNRNKSSVVFPRNEALKYKRVGLNGWTVLD
eukprot:493167_1